MMVDTTCAICATELLDPSSIALCVMVSMMTQKHQETMKFPLIFLNLVSGQRSARESHDHLLWLPHVRLITAAWRFWTVSSHGNAISHDTLLSPLA
jgi:hypothetical protein